MEFSLTTRELHPRHAFRIARARRRAVCNVFLRLTHEGVTGYGEASPNAYYHETEETVREKLTAAGEFIRGLAPESPGDIAAIWERSWAWLAPSRAAQCALDLALWDWLAKRQGVPVAELAWGEAPHEVESFCTIGLSTPEELVVKVTELEGFPLVKIKSDQAADLRTVREVRAALEARIAVDANAAWEWERLPALAAELAELGVSFVEQPLDPAMDARLNKSAYALPVVADESCVVESDVERVAQHFSGFNIKLVKCGGLTPGLRMLKRGRELGCQVMVGCMLESSALIAAGAVIGQQTDYADLDGAWLLSDDPFRGLDFKLGRVQPAKGASGFGVEPEPGLFPA